jgi:Zn-dependent peptidase ImmA (M78 family)/transcriptional regulator with XRE-family HTH domain
LFDGARLRLARHLAGLRKSDLAARVDKSPTAVAAWESGAKRPTAATVAQLALSLSVDPGFFAMRPDDVAAVSSTPHFRSLRSTSQLARDQAFAYGQLAVDITTSLEKHVEFPEPDMPSYPVSVDDRESDGPEQAAQLVRRQWGLDLGPAGHLVRLVENHGVLVVFSPHGAASVDAYSFDSRLRPVVILNPIKRDYYRQRFDVAHELGHLVMHSDAEPGGRIVEEQAHRFAAELLMPGDQIRDLLPATMGGDVWRKLARLKEQWGVSIQALLYRARWLGRLSDVSYRNAMTTISARGWRRDEPGLVSVIEQPSLLPRAMELLAQEGISQAGLIEQCRVPADLFRMVTSRMPAAQPPDEAGLANDLAPGGRVVSLLDHWAAGTDPSSVAHTPTEHTKGRERSGAHCVGGLPASSDEPVAMTRGERAERGIDMTNRRIVQHRDDGKWEVRKPGADRASAVMDTQAQGIDRAREILGGDGGGELQVRALDGTIRAQDTIPPGNDPRSSRG